MKGSDMKKRRSTVGVDKYVVKFTKSGRRVTTLADGSYVHPKLSILSVARFVAKSKARTSGRSTSVQNTMTGKTVYKCTSKAKCKLIGRSK